MAPIKPGTLMGILRKQARANASHHTHFQVVKPGSAFAQLGKKNEAARAGVKTGDEDDEDEDEPSIPTAKRAKKAAPNRVTKPKKPAVVKAKLKLVECWRPAGGEQQTKCGEKKEEDKITDTLGFARLATWQVNNFREALVELVKEHGEMEKVVAKETVHGAESWTDIFVKFRSELVAEMVKEKIDGDLVNGRKLQIVFA